MRFPYFQETLRRDLAMARRDRRFVTLLVFEIVEFAVYRQTFGDKAADSCQRMIGAQIMRALRRAGDLCARYDDTTLVAAVDRAACRARFNRWRSESPKACGSSSCTIRAPSRAAISRRASIVIGCPPGAHDDPEPLIARALAEARGTDAAAARRSRLSRPGRQAAGRRPEPSCAGTGVTRTSTPNAG